MKKNQLAAQIYTCRELTKTPFEISRILRRVREAGCTSVQASGLGPIADDELSRMLDGEELICCATHEPDAVLAASGMTLRHHNHHQEFRKIDGTAILEKFYASTSARHLQGELDTYWVQYGGGGPAAWCERLSGRLPLVHLNDYMVNDENDPACCEICSGDLDSARIVAAAEKAGCQYFIVEQDEKPDDPVDSLAQSFRHLAENICKE